jgi:hypothetical protein
MPELERAGVYKRPLTNWHDEHDGNVTVGSYLWLVNTPAQCKLGGAQVHEIKEASD